MTGLLSILGLIVTGFNLTTYVPGVNIDTGSDEYQRNYIEVQRQIITEDFFTFATQLGKYNYARGCAGGYGPDVWDKENQKRINCSKRSFDCGGVIKAYGAIKGILTRKEVGRNNSATLYKLGQPISPEMAQRGDYTFRQLVSGSGLASTHGAIVSQPLSGGVIEIFDGLKGKFEERDLILHCNDSYCIYNTNNGHYKIKFSTNPLYEVAMTKGITVDPFVTSGDNQQDTGTQYQMCMVDPNNPLGYYIIIDGYPYDSLANRTANRWYVRNHSKDMIATYLCENGGFNPDAKSQTNDGGLCQLHGSVTSNYYWIHDPRWNSKDPIEQFAFQRQACLDKWNLVQDHNAIWSCYKNRSLQLKRIKNMTGGYRSIDSI